MWINPLQGCEPNLHQYHHWLVVSTPLKNINQNGNLPQIGVKIKHSWNHHPDHLWTGKLFASEDGATLVWDKNDSLPKKHTFHPTKNPRVVYQLKKKYTTNNKKTKVLINPEVFYIKKTDPKSHWTIPSTSRPLRPPNPAWNSTGQQTVHLRLHKG